jgi:hypothetical protein
VAVRQAGEASPQLTLLDRAGRRSAVLRLATDGATVLQTRDLEGDPADGASDGAAGEDLAAAPETSGGRAGEEAAREATEATPGVQLRDANGRNRGTFHPGPHGEGAGLVLRDGQGRDRAQVALDGRGRCMVALLDGTSAARVGLAREPGQPTHVVLFDAAGRGRLGLVHGDDGSSVMSLHDEDGDRRVVLELARKTPSALLLRDREDRPIFREP